MKTLARNGSNDLYISGRKLAVSSDADCQCDIIEAIICTQQGELQFDETRGIDYFGTAFLNPRYIQMWAAQVRSAVSELSWVKSIESFDYTFNREEGRIEWTMTVLNDSDERLDLRSRKKNPNKTDMKFKAKWDDVVGKPKEIPQAVDFVRNASRAATDEEPLAPRDSLDDVKRVLNKTVLIPGNAKDRDYDDDVRLSLSGVVGGQVVFSSSTLRVDALSSWIVDYGDGTALALASEANEIPAHMYEADGDYTVSLNGVFAEIAKSQEPALASSSAPDASSDWDHLLTAVKIGRRATLKRLGSGVFSGCENLRTLDAKESHVESLGDRCFAGCVSLQDLSGLPLSVKAIGVRCFAGCSSLANLKGFPASLTEIPEGTFENCVGLLSVSGMSDGISGVGDAAFFGCVNLQNVNGLPDGLSRVGSKAFAGCEKLAAFSFPLGISFVGSSAFDGASSLSRLESFSKIPTTVHPEAFVGIPPDCSLYVPYGCGESYATADGWREIATRKEFECITLSLNPVGSGWENDNGTGVVSSNTAWVADFGDGYRKRMPSGQSAVPRHKYSRAGTYDISLIGCFTELRSGASAGYGSNAYPFLTDRRGVETSTLKKVSFTPNSSLVNIWDYCFKYSVGLEEVEGLPMTLDFLGKGVFFRCTQLARFVLPNGVDLSTIGDECFYGCSALEDVRLYGRAESVPSGCFQGCTGLSDVILPPLAKSIGKSAFRECASLQTLSWLPTSVAEIGDSSFYQCHALTSIQMPSSVRKLGRYAFFGCTGLTSLVGMSENVETIGDGAFEDCTGLRSLTGISPRLKGLPIECFAGCSSLVSIEALNSCTSWEYNTLSGSVFRGCSSLEYISGLPSVVKQIGMSAFEGCASLTKITNAPSDVTTLHARAFAGCENLYDFGFWPNLVTIGDECFAGDDKIAEIVIPHKVTSIGSLAFTTSGLTLVRALPENPPLVAEDSFAVMEGVELRVPYASREPYESDQVWSRFSIKPVGIAFRLSEANGGDRIIGNGFANSPYGFTVSWGDGSTDHVGSGYGAEIPSHIYADSVSNVEIVFSGEIGYLGGSNGLPILHIDGDGLDSRFYEVRVTDGTGVAELNADAFRGYGSEDRQLSVYLDDRAVEKIGDNVFADSSLGLISLVAENPPTAEESAFDGIDKSKVLVTVPSSAMSAYASADIWEEFDYSQNMLTVFTVRLPRSGTWTFPADTIKCRQKWRVCYDWHDDLEDNEFSDYLEPSTRTIPSHDYGVEFDGRDFKIAINGWIEELRGGDVPYGNVLSSANRPDDLVDIKSVEIRGGVPIERIGDCAFGYCSLESLAWMPDTVLSLGSNAFRKSGLKSLNGLPISISSVGEGCFESCESLTSLAGFPKTDIPSKCFRYCSGLRSLDGLPVDGMTSIGEGAFQQSGLTSLVGMPVSVTSIDAYAFERTGLVSLEGMSHSVTSFGVRVFADCESLTTLVGFPIVARIPEGCFVGCSSLESLNGLPEGVETFGEHAFYGTGIKSLTGCPSSVQTFEDGAFSGAALTSLDGLGSVESFGEGCFARNPIYGAVVLPSSVSVIGDNCFSDCKNIISISISSSSVDFGGGVFDGCSGLTEIVVSSPNPPRVVERFDQTSDRPSTFRGIDILKTRLTLTGQAEEARQDYLDSSWRPFLFDKSKYVGFAGIGSGASWSGETGLGYRVSVRQDGEPSPVMIDYGDGEFAFSTPDASQLFVPQHFYFNVSTTPRRIFGDVVGIEVGAEEDAPFFSVNGDKSIHSDEEPFVTQGLTSFESVGDYSFKGLEAFARDPVRIPPSTARIGTKAFYGCTAVDADAVSGVADIGDGAFEASTLITPYGGAPFRLSAISSLGVRAFAESFMEDGEDDHELDISSSTLTSIPKEAFLECGWIGSASLSCPNLRSIGEYAFYQTLLNSLTITSPVPPDCDQTSFGGDLPLSEINLYVPAESVSSYGNHPVFGQMNVNAIA